jgi:UDP-glucose 4-epimerase
MMMKKMKKILITGSSGYIGRHLADLLKNDFVVGLDKVFRPQMTEKFIQQDINDHKRIWHPDGGYDVVVHLAAHVNVGKSVIAPMQYYRNNIGGTMSMLENVDYDHFIFASTGAAANPTSPYATSKLAAESLVREFCGLNGKKATIFRFYNVVGSSGYEPTNVDGLMYNLMKARRTGEFNLFGTDYETPDGTCIRDYVHILEVCEAIRNAIEQPVARHELENLGSGIGYTVKQMIETFKIVNECDFKVNYLPRREGDLAKSVLNGVSPYMQVKYTIDEMMKV